MSCGIYSIICLSTNKKYIGSSINIKKRWVRHVWELNNNKHGNSYLQRAWNKYNSDNFKFEILELCETSLLIDKERLYMVGNIIPKGFNIRTDPISLHGTSNPFYGKHHSKETKEKISNSKKGKLYGEEVKEKLRKASAVKKLSDMDVKEIRKKYKQGISTLKISTEYNIARAYVYDIVNKKRRSYVK